MAVKDMISPKPGLNSTVTGAGSDAQPEIKKVLQSNKTDLFIKNKNKKWEGGNSLAKHSKNVKRRTKNEKNNFGIDELRDFNRLQQRTKNQRT
jgi:hypothetical protein